MEKNTAGIHDGHLITITEIGKNIATDEWGNVWSYDKTWNMNYVPKGKVVEGVSDHGIDRHNAWFNVHKQGQALLAQAIMEKICPQCVSEPFEEINDIKAHSFPDMIYKLDDLIVQKMLEHENEKAMKTLQKMFDEQYNHDYKRIEPFQSD